MSKLLKIEKYLIKKSDKLAADDTYITDNHILIAKKHLNNELLKEYKTYDGNIMDTIPYEKGEDWELSDYAMFRPSFNQPRRFVFEINKEFGVNDYYIWLFEQAASGFATFTVVNAYYDERKGKFPIVKVWRGEEFLGLIACVQFVKITADKIIIDGIDVSECRWINHWKHCAVFNILIKTVKDQSGKYYKQLRRKTH